MKKASFSEALQDLLRRDTRYSEPAYFFVREGLDHTIKQLAKPPEGPARHVTGRELSEGLRDLALKEFGPMARTVLAHWGVHATGDFGNIVFNLVGEGILGKTDQDRPDDFLDVYDFEESFSRPFQPAAAPRPAAGVPPPAAP